MKIEREHYNKLEGRDYKDREGLGAGKHVKRARKAINREIDQDNFNEVRNSKYENTRNFKKQEKIKGENAEIGFKLKREAGNEVNAETGKIVTNIIKESKKVQGVEGINNADRVQFRGFRLKELSVNRDKVEGMNDMGIKFKFVNDGIRREVGIRTTEGNEIVGTKVRLKPGEREFVRVRTRGI